MTYIRYFLFTAVPVIMLFAGLSCIHPPISGDLARLGRFSELDFGWNEPQPVVKVREDIGAAGPDIIVLGDSFSANNIWQSIVMDERGDKVLTIGWVRPESLAWWVASLKSRYPTARYLIVETAERSAITRLAVSQDGLPVHDDFPVKISASETKPMRDTSVLHSMHDPVYAIFATLHLFKSFEENTHSGPVVIEPLNRHDLFSNKRSDLLLYFEDDDENKQRWTDEAVDDSCENLERINHLASKNGMTLILAVVPDKSTIYRKYFRIGGSNKKTPDIWAAINRRGLRQVDLHTVMASSVEDTRDLYQPDDTHLSPKGYMLMGRAIARYLDALESTATEALSDR